MSRRRQLPLPSFVEGSTALHQVQLQLRVAFRDCDPMGVLWHGNYLAYCESARNHLGQELGFSIARIQELQLMAPVVRSQVVHHHPARPEELLDIQVGLYRTCQPRLYHRYRMSSGGTLLAEAETEQVFVDAQFHIVLTQPPELAALLNPGPAQA